MHPSGRLQTGALLEGRWQVLGTLGQGAMGVVYRAREGATGREVALKVLAGGLSPERRERFRREGALCAALEHPGIVRVHAAGEWGPRPFLIYELVEGARPLDQVLPGLARPERLSLVLAVARALAHAHERGVVHRDVKPDNVLVGADGLPRLADFGLATAADQERLTRTGALVGTPGYMAPEQFQGGAQTGPHSDVWSLGVILYQALVERPPFEAGSLAELAGKLLHQPVVPPCALDPDVAPGLERVVLTALARDPARRYPHAGALAEDLERHLRGAPVQGAGRRAAKLARGPIVVIVACVGLALVAASALLLARQASSTLPPDAGPAPTTRTEASDAGGGPPSAPSPAGPTGPAWFAALPARERPKLPAGLTPAEAPGTYRWARDGSLLVWVPPGRYVEGHDGDATQNDHPAHRLVLTRGVFMGRCELERERYLAYCRLTGAPEPVTPLLLLSQVGPAHPVTNVNTDDAEAYCAWAGLRLPSSAEWEAAGRGPEGRLYPWGDAPEPGRANLAGDADGYSSLAPAESFLEAASWCGTLNQLGNVWEWMRDDTTEYSPLEAVDPLGSPNDRSRAVRGGCFTSDLDRLSWRRRQNHVRREEGVGFRVALEPPV